jgi:hypothetical protein
MPRVIIPKTDWIEVLDRPGPIYYEFNVDAATIQKMAAVGHKVYSVGADGSTTLCTDTPDETPPTVVSVTPSGTESPRTGSITITFDEPMASTEGTVALDNGASTSGGNWTNSTTYVVNYSGLSATTQYTVTISGFEDIAGNTMVEDSTHKFTTEAVN